MSSKNILILLNDIKGLFAFRKEVVEALIENGYQVWVSCPDEPGEKTDYFVGLGCRMLNTPVDRRGTNPLRDFGLFRHYIQIMRQVKPVAVLTYTIKPNVYGGMAARRMRIPLFANITGLGTAVENPGMLQKITVGMYRFGLKKAHTVFYQNRSIQQFCQEHAIGRKGVLLPGSGVNLDWHMLQSYPGQESNIRFLFIGRVMRDKGIGELLSAASAIKAKYPQTEFHVFGYCEDSFENPLKEACQRGTVEWHGFVPDMRPHMRDAWCTVHPSYHEGMANVLLESAAAGRPVITTDVSGCREAVDDGETGFLCRVKDVDSLTAAMERFIELPYEDKVSMGVRGREKMAREFDRSFVVRAYLEGIRSVE